MTKVGVAGNSPAMTDRTILCFGDSNTHGTLAMRSAVDRRRFPPDQRWPNIMATALGANYEVIAEGHPGRNAVFDDPVEGAHKNGLRALPVLLESHRPIDLVTIMLGTNDLKARFSVPVSDIATGIDRLVMEILHSDAGPKSMAPKVLVAAPVPIIETGFLAEMFAGGTVKSHALGGHLRALAKRRRVGFVDLAEVAEVDPVDGIHLDAEAQAAIGAAMARAVQGYLKA